MTKSQAETQAPAKPENPYAKAYAGFLEQTKNHQLAVLHEDGVYRHLRVQESGTRMWSWDITTWPGHLATSGDVADGYTFTRLFDMIDFFDLPAAHRDYYSDGAPSLDFRYWAEKLCGGRSHEVKEHSRELFMQHVNDVLSEHEDVGDEAQAEHQKQRPLLEKLYQLRGLDEEALTSALKEYWSTRERAERTIFSKPLSEIAAKALSTLWSTEGLSDQQYEQLAEQDGWFELADTEIARQSPAERRAEIVQDAEWVSGSEDLARQWLQNNTEYFGEDTWECDFRDYDLHFLFACYCIDLAVQLYRQHAAKRGVNDTYVLVREDRVQNRPAQPVIDLSMFDTGVPDKHLACEALIVRTKIMAVPQAREELPEAIQDLTALVQEHGDAETIASLEEILAAEHAAAEKREQQEAEHRARILRSQEQQEQQAQQAQLRADRKNQHSADTATQEGAPS